MFKYSILLNSSNSVFFHKQKTALGIVTKHRLKRCDCLYFADYMYIRTIWGGISHILSNDYYQNRCKGTKNNWNMQIFESEFYFFYGKAGKSGISGPLCKSGGEEKVGIFADGTTKKERPHPTSPVGGWGRSGISNPPCMADTKKGNAERGNNPNPNLSYDRPQDARSSRALHPIGGGGRSGISNPPCMADTKKGNAERGIPPPRPSP